MPVHAGSKAADERASVEGHQLLQGVKPRNLTIEPEQCHVMGRPARVRSIVDKHLILRMWILSMDKLKVYLIRAGKTFEGSTGQVCDEIAKQIDYDFALLLKKGNSAK